MKAPLWEKKNNFISLHKKVSNMIKNTNIKNHAT